MSGGRPVSRDSERMLKKVHEASSDMLLEYAVEPKDAALGLLLDEKHVVHQICTDSPLEGKLMVGDRIFAINNISVSSLDQHQLSIFIDELREDREPVVLKVERNPKRNKERSCTSASTSDLKPPPQTIQTSPSSGQPFLSPDQGRHINRRLRSPPTITKKIFPVMTEYGISMGHDSSSKDVRKLLLSELIRWNERHNQEHEFSWYSGSDAIESSPTSCKLFWVPSAGPPAKRIQVGETPTKELLEACRNSLLFDQTIRAVTNFFGFQTKAESLNLWLHYFANTQAEAYEKHHEVAKRKVWDLVTERKRQEAQKQRRIEDTQPQRLHHQQLHQQQDQQQQQQQQQQSESTSQRPQQQTQQKIEPQLFLEDFNGKEEASVAAAAAASHSNTGNNKRTRKEEQDENSYPQEFQDFDGSGDSRWNLRYLDLINFKNEHGHCMVSTREVPLGKWVAWQRESWRKNYASLTVKRKQLLDDLGFIWEAKHANRQPHVETGDPKLNKSLALKVVYGPLLSEQQAFFVSGFTQEEMDEVRNPSHPWRNGLVVLKKRLDARMKTFMSRQSSEQESSAAPHPRRKTMAAVQELIYSIKYSIKYHKSLDHVLGRDGAKLLQDYLTSNNTRDMSTIEGMADHHERFGSNVASTENNDLAHEKSLASKRKRRDSVGIFLDEVGPPVDPIAVFNLNTAHETQPLAAPAAATFDPMQATTTTAASSSWGTTNTGSEVQQNEETVDPNQHPSWRRDYASPTQTEPTTF